jgi:putative membrane protein
MINAVALFAAVQLLSGRIIMENDQWYAYLVLGLIFGLVNALIKPIVMFASCPLVILTLGLGTLLVNTLMFLIVGWIGDGFGYGFTIPVNQFWNAFLGAMIVSIISFILSRFLITRKSNK